VPRRRGWAFGARTSNAAAAGGHTAALQWLLTADGPGPSVGRDGFARAARAGHLAVLQWLWAHPLAVSNDYHFAARCVEVTRAGVLDCH
jgi:hypothetical protein